jgi:AcrR family transcriptional regulator
MPADRRREHLIDAALDVILRQGYGGVSIEAVARAAGVTRPVIYDHFANLGRLLQALVEREERYSPRSSSRCCPRTRETETRSSSWPGAYGGSSTRSPVGGQLGG